jgi:hypothetical protein
MTGGDPMPDPQPPPERTPAIAIRGVVFGVLVALAAKVGLDATDDTVGQVAMIVAGALAEGIVLVMTHSRVTPWAKALRMVFDAEQAGKAKVAEVEKEAHELIVAATTTAAAAPGWVEPVYYAPAVVPPPPPPPPPPAADPFEARPPVGLMPPTPPRRQPCPTCAQPVIYATIRNDRNDRWTVLPLEDASAPDVEADFELTGDTHEAVDILGNPAGVLPVAVYVNADVGNSYRTHPPSHFLGHEH